MVCWCPWPAPATVHRHSQTRKRKTTTGEDTHVSSGLPKDWPAHLTCPKTTAYHLACPNTRGIIWPAHHLACPKKVLGTLRKAALAPFYSRLRRRRPLSPTSTPFVWSLGFRVSSQVDRRRPCWKAAPPPNDFLRKKKEQAHRSRVHANRSLNRPGIAPEQLGGGLVRSGNVI